MQLFEYLRKPPCIDQPQDKFAHGVRRKKLLPWLQNVFKDRFFPIYQDQDATAEEHEEIGRNNTHDTSTPMS